MNKGKNSYGESYIDSNGCDYAKINNIWGLFNWAIVKYPQVTQLSDMSDNPSLVKTYGLEQLALRVNTAMSPK